MKYALLLLSLFLSSCTCSVTVVHTEGTASDVVDEKQTPSTSISPSLTVPAKVL